MSSMIHVSIPPSTQHIHLHIFIICDEHIWARARSTARQHVLDLTSTCRSIDASVSPSGDPAEGDPPSESHVINSPILATQWRIVSHVHTSISLHTHTPTHRGHHGPRTMEVEQREPAPACHATSAPHAAHTHCECTVCESVSCGSHGSCDEHGS